MTTPDNRTAWADFWAAGPPQSDATCLPNALREIVEAQVAIWCGFARELEKGAHVLDLATGDGVVLKTMREARSDLVLTGVDSSPVLPPPPRGIRLRAGVSMESLPFKAGAFAAITSQFGYEYGDTQATSGEVGRLLRPGAKLRFVIHHSDGPIVAHNLPRRDALLWALSPGGYVAKARGLLAARRISAIPTPPAFREAPLEAQRRFPDQSVASEFLQALLVTLEMGRDKPVHYGFEVIDTLESKAKNEIARIETLERAACDAGRIETIGEELRTAGIEVAPPAIVTERSSGRVFAWLVSGIGQG